MRGFTFEEVSSEVKRVGMSDDRETNEGVENTGLLKTDIPMDS